jgi:hypothetical protein
MIKPEFTVINNIIDDKIINLKFHLSEINTRTAYYFNSKAQTFSYNIDTRLTEEDPNRGTVVLSVNTISLFQSLDYHISESKRLEYEIRDLQAYKISLLLKEQND